MIPSCQRNLLLMPQGLGEVGGGGKPWKCRPEGKARKTKTRFSALPSAWNRLR